MKKLIPALAIAFLSVSTPAAIIDADVNGAGDDCFVNSHSVEYVPNEIIVKFRESVANIVETQLELKTSVRQLTLSQGLDELNARYRVKDIKPLVKGFKAQRQRMAGLLKKDKTSLTRTEEHLLGRLKRAPKGAKTPELDRIYKIEIDRGQSAEQAVAEYKQNPDVEYAELNYIVHADISPDDPYFNVQWALNNTCQPYPVSGGGTDSGSFDSDIDAPYAWDIYTGSSEVIVAVIDSGVDYTHNDLVGNMWTDPNGRFGFDFVNDDNDPMDDFGHGTHCAGIIASRTNNGMDTAGVCWNVKIMAVKFLDFKGSGTESDAVNAVYYAVNNSADVLSNSWGGSYSASLEDAINYAYSQGLIIVAAAGNNNSSSPHYPAYYDHVISVAATDSSDNKASFSNYGEWVDIAAPGLDILSLRAQNTDMYLGTPGYNPRDRFVPFGDPYATMYIASGTSMACPFVSGACALMSSVNPALTSDQTTSILVNTVDPIADGICYSDGRLNLSDALIQTILSMSKGRIALDSDYYNCDCNVCIFLADGDLSGQGVCSISITTTGGDSETVTLTEKSPPIGAFAGMIHTATGAPIIEDGNLQVADGDIIYAEYYDANDDTGNPATVTDNSIIDCIPPVITDVQMDLIASKLIVTFNSNEPTTGKVSCGSQCGGPYTIEGYAGMQTSHTIEAEPLLPFTTYYFIVTAVDAAENQTVDSNSGSCYSFIASGPGDVCVPGEYATIQQALDYAWPGSVIRVEDGVYTGEGNRDIDFRGKTLTLRSENGPLNCIIDCNGEVNEPHRGFYFHTAETQDSVLDGFTVTNGFGPNDFYYDHEIRKAGGGIFCFYSSPAINNCIIINNRTSYSPGYEDGVGAGICCESSNLIISNCTVIDNIAGYGVGGGFFGHNTNAHITDCNISSNNAGNGCGAFFNGGAPVIDRCIISNNSSYSARGALYFQGAAAPEITNCLITGNMANPGGICCWYGGGSAVINNCTIVNNKPAVWGGAVYWNGGSAAVTNCICYGNHQTDLSVGGLRELYEDLTVSYTDIHDNGDPADFKYVPGIGNIDCDPCFVDDANDNYRLKTGSTCVNAGDPCYIADPCETDIYGKPRVLFSRIDMGCDEWPGGAPFLGILPFELNFEAFHGDPNPDSQTVTIRNLGSEPLNWAATIDINWLTIDVNSGLCPAFSDSNLITVDVNIAALDAGTYYGSIVVSDPCALNSPRTVLILLEVKMYNIADLDKSLIVDFTDFAVFSSQWFRAPGIPSADIAPPQGDGFVDLEDLDVFCQNWLDGSETLYDLDANLVSHWKLDGDADDAVGSNHGILNGGTWVEGKIGLALECDGTDDYIDVGNDSSLNPSRITVSLWFKSNDNTRSIITRGTSGSTYNKDWDIFGTGSEIRWVGVNWGGNIWQIIGTPYPSLGQWHHIAGTWNGTTDANGVKFYLDGSLVNSTTSSDTALAAHNLYIGGYSPSGSYEFDGTIDDVRIYNRVLSKNEIKLLYLMGD